jgi:hypothetical protein
VGALYNTAGLTSPALLGKGEPMSPEARERSFDELASGLASGTLSRGKALRLMGAALVGGLLAFTPKVAEAAPASWCYQVNASFFTCNQTWSKKECEAMRESADPPALGTKCRRANTI